MLAITKRSPRLPEKERRRTRLVSSCCSRRLGRDVQGRHRLLRDDAGLPEAVARLEALHARLDIGVEDRRHAGRLIEIAGDLEAVAQRHDGLALGADMKAGAVRHRAPAALGDDVLIGCHGGLGGGDRRGRERRASSPA